MLVSTLSLSALLLFVLPASARVNAHSKRRNAGHDEIAARQASAETDQLYERALVKARAAASSKNSSARRRASSCSAGSSSTVSASASTSPSATSSAAAAAASTPTTGAFLNTTSPFNSPWKLDSEASGSTFFDKWSFWEWDDPTHGTVQYQSAANSWNQGLVSINSKGNAVLKVDTTKQVSGGRKSVRLHSTYTFNGGLIIMDASHMPTGCGTWPAFWANGPNWPAGGEIDILEGVNDFTNNQVSLHTSDGCTIPASFGAEATTQLTTGNFDNTNCASYATANQGCGQRSTSANNYGAGFNSIGGGVYAMKWDSSGISVYFFPRGSIPSDITAGTPVPSGWGAPQANFPSTSCDPYTFFKDNFAIINTTLCGDWAGNIWNDSGYAGQSQSCAAKTGYATCADYVLNNGDKLTDAYWEFAYVKYYQPK